MSNVLDLQIAPLNRQNGQELPSLLAMTPPRRTGRGREQDRLVVYLVLTGNTTFSTAEYVQMTSQVAAQFYQTAGSLTHAMRAGADALNRALLERNLRTTGRGQFAIGWLVLGALRGTQVVLLLSGPTHVMVSGRAGMRHIHDPALSGRGLGLSQTMTTYFAQAELQPGDVLLLCGKAPPAWEGALSASKGADGMDALRRRLMAAAEAETNAVLVQVQSGRGQVVVLKGGRSEPAVEPAAVTPAEPPAVGQAPQVEQPAAGLESVRNETPPAAYSIPVQVEATVTINKHPERSLDVEDFPAPGAQEGEDPEATVMRVRRRTPSEGTRRAARTAVDGMRAWRRLTSGIGVSLRRMMPRLLPGEEGQEAAVRLPAWWMGFVAVAVPLVVVTIASLVYFRFGSGLQYQELYSQAEAEAARAASETDPVRQREAWQKTLLLLEEVENHRTTDESRALRSQAQASLDGLLGIVRLDFQKAISGGKLDGNVRVTRLAATDMDLYMLDEKSNKVLRSFWTSGGYQMDASFECRSGPYGGYQVGTLVDIFAPPKGNEAGASVMAIDEAGSLLYCAPNQDPQAVPLPPPDTSWNGVSAATLDGDLLYVLDAGANAVWVYVGRNGIFEERPLFFFGEQVPSVGGAIDLAVNGDDLYLLHSDGYLITCTYNRIDSIKTRCTDPATLVDLHPANQGINPFLKTQFTQMLFATPPDSTVILLDSIDQVLFRFSPRSLELQNQLHARSDNPLPRGTVSAMTMSPNHTLFLAFEDRIYFAVDVP